MLIKCPECGLQLSDKALSCPHCGYPIVQTAFKAPKKKKHTRLPNGFGQIVKLNKPLRNPYRVMVTVGKTDEGKPICRLLKPQAYFATYNEAYEALLEYNKDPYDLDDAITTKELYEKWFNEYSQNIKDTSKRTVKSAWAYCSSVYDIRVKDIRIRHIKGCMDSAESPNIKSRIKSVFNLMLDYALEHDLVKKNYARSFNVSDETKKQVEENKTDHISFTEKEMDTLWNHKHVKYVNIILFQCYSGFRPQELGLILKSNVNLDEGYIIAGMKTDAGINRIVPIHECVRDIVEKAMNTSKSEYLFECVEEDMTDKFLTYDKYRRRFEKVIKQLNLNPEHRPHDPRKTFVTMAKEAKLDEYAIKRIVGHSINDITESVYTDRPSSWLIEEMKKINSPCNKR